MAIPAGQVRRSGGERRAIDESEGLVMALTAHDLEFEYMAYSHHLEMGSR